MDLEANLRAVAEYLTKRGGDPRKLDGIPTLCANYMGMRGPLVCYAHLHCDPDALVFYAITQHQAPELTRTAVAEFMTLANYDLALGNFELDMGDGEMRYKSSAPLPDGAVSQALLDALSNDAVAMLDLHLPGLLAVCSGTCTPLEGITMVADQVR